MFEFEGDDYSYFLHLMRQLIPERDFPQIIKLAEESYQKKLEGKPVPPSLRLRLKPPTSGERRGSKVLKPYKTSNSSEKSGTVQSPCGSQSFHNSVSSEIREHLEGSRSLEDYGPTGRSEIPEGSENCEQSGGARNSQFSEGTQSIGAIKDSTLIPSNETQWRVKRSSASLSDEEGAFVSLVVDLTGLQIRGPGMTGAVTKSYHSEPGESIDIYLPRLAAQCAVDLQAAKRHKRIATERSFILIGICCIWEHRLIKEGRTKSEIRERIHPIQATYLADRRPSTANEQTQKAYRRACKSSVKGRQKIFRECGALGLQNLYARKLLLYHRLCINLTYGSWSKLACLV